VGGLVGGLGGSGCWAGMVVLFGGNKVALPVGTGCLLSLWPRVLLTTCPISTFAGIGTIGGAGITLSTLELTFTWTTGAATLIALIKEFILKTHIV
jgi:hypothetical protein